MRKMAREQVMSSRTMRRLVTGDLQMRPFKLQSRQLLGAATKAKRLARAKLLRGKLREGTLRNIVFSDEKLFTVQASFNQQNDRVLSCNRQSIPEDHGRVFRTQKPASVMVWAAVSESGKSPLVFVPQGVKINREVYIRDILEASLKPWAANHFRDQHWTFQQDGATSHTARETQQWCQNNCPGFITKEEWPPSSPDLNPLDYSLWSVLESKVCSVPHRSIDHLKRDLVRAWQRIPDDVVFAAVGDFRRRLTATVQAKGGHFE